MRKNKPWTPDPVTHEEMVAEWMKDPAFRAEYDALEDEYQLIREMLLARRRAGLTQENVAKIMGTKAPAIARLESSSARDKHSPSLNTLRKYAGALGCKLEIRLKPFPKRKKNALTHKSGEVRKLKLKDIRAMRPTSEILPADLCKILPKSKVVHSPQKQR